MSTSLCFISPAFQAEWVALNYVPFAERSLEVVVDLYHKTACHKAVINEKVLQNVIKVLYQTLHTIVSKEIILCHIDSFCLVSTSFLFPNRIHLMPNMICTLWFFHDNVPSKSWRSRVVSHFSMTTASNCSFPIVYVKSSHSCGNTLPNSYYEGSLWNGPNQLHIPLCLQSKEAILVKS